MEKMTIYCSKCKRPLSASPEAAGQKVSCPACGAGVAVDVIGCQRCGTKVTVVSPVESPSPGAPPAGPSAPTGATKLRVRRVRDDDIEAVSPEDLMSSVSKSRVGWTLIVSIIFHVVVILLLSTGMISLCFHYRTPNPWKAVDLREGEKKEEEERKKAEKKEKRRQEIIERAKEEAKRREEEEKKKADKAKKAEEGKPVPKIIEEITEVSDERPKESGLGSIDDELE